MCVNYVVDRFALISGLSPQEISDWIFLCADACDYIESVLVDRENKDKADERRLINAAAVYAFYRYCLYAYEDLDSFKAGDVEVTRREDMLGRAEKMWQREKESLRGIINTDSGFLFRRM